MKAVIRTDASIEIGSGHVMRCLTLAKQLRANNFEVCFICREHEGHLIELIENEGFAVYALQNSKLGNNQYKKNDGAGLHHSHWLGETQPVDAEDCGAILAKIKPDWLIVDHYAIDQTWESALQNHYDKLMVIDDIGDRRHRCDLLLDQNLDSTLEKYRDLTPEGSQLLLGPKYALLRPEFAEWRKPSLERRNKVEEPKKILISLGGVDKNNLTGEILKQLAVIEINKSIFVTVVLGPGSPHFLKVEKLIQEMPFKTELKSNVSNMAELMCQSDLAIGAAGSTSWERCCMGLPTIQFVIAENQRLIAQALADEGAIKYANSVSELPDLIINAKKWTGLASDSAQKLVDGLGAERVVEQMIGIEL